MRTNYYSLIMVIAFIAVTLTSCGKKTTEVSRNNNPFSGGVYELPCAMYDDKDNFAATGIASGSEGQMGALQISALKNAQDMIAMKIEHAVEGEVSTYFETIGRNTGTDIDASTRTIINNSIMGVVKNTTACCQLWSGVDDRGDVKCYIGIKIPKEEIVEAVTENLSKDTKGEIRDRHNEAQQELARKKMLENLQKHVEQ